MFLLIPMMVCPPTESPFVAIANATIIVGTESAPIPNGVLVIRGSRIVACGPVESTPIPADARRIDASGKWIIPGLIDMHVHLDEDISPGAFVLHGVTSVRDVGSRLVTLQRLRVRAAKGEVLPRLYWMGRNIDEGKPSWWGAVAVRGPEAVPALLADMKRQGVDGVKLYVRAGPKVSRAVIREAHRLGWPVTGHLQDTLPSQAAKMGIDNLEHVSTLFLDLNPKKKVGTQGFKAAFVRASTVDLDSLSAKALIRLLKQKNVAITPTLATGVLPVEGEAAASRLYDGWTSIPKGWRQYWATPYWDFIKPKDWTSRDFETARIAERKSLDLVGKLNQAGVPIVAGTDTPAPWVLPGAGLQVELELLTKAGLTPMEAIRAATGRAAYVLRKVQDVGTLQTGRFADFVVLSADPLADIRNARKIEEVYLNGREIDLSALKRVFQTAVPPANPPGP